MTTSDYNYQNSFRFCFVIGICQSRWGLKNNSPNLHKKTTNWRILLVVVKWCHRAIVLLLSWHYAVRLNSAFNPPSQYLNWYSRQERLPNTFHLRGLREILGITYQHRAPNIKDILAQAGVPSMFALLSQRRRAGLAMSAAWKTGQFLGTYSTASLPLELRLPEGLPFVSKMFVNEIWRQAISTLQVGKL